MTESEWSAHTILYPLVDFLEGRVGGRKLWLFGCACCRRIWPLLTDTRSRAVVEVAERFADGVATAQEFEAAARAAAAAADDARSAAHENLAQPAGEAGLLHLHAAQVATKAADAAAHLAGRIGDEPRFTDLSAAAFAATGAAGNAKAEALRNSVSGGQAAMPLRERIRAALVVGEAASAAGWAEEAAQCDLLRDLFGPLPFRRPPVDSRWLAWQGGTVRRLAEGIYEGRAFDQLPILADALEEAGCADAKILGHLRGPAPHVRGCWVVDLLLGKE